MEKSCREEFNIKRHDEQTTNFKIKSLTEFSSIEKIHGINNMFISDKVLFKAAVL